MLVSIFVCCSAACRAGEPSPVADALLREQLRLEIPRTTDAQRIEAAADRFLAYYPLATKAADVHRIDSAFRRYNQNVLHQLRERFNDTIIRNRELWFGPQ